MLNLQRSAGNDAFSRSLSNHRPGTPLPVQRARDSKYGDGTYGARNRERRYLEDEWDAPIDGNSSHQAEHPLLYSASAPRRLTGVRRGQSGQTGEDARYVENHLPAYYETYREHRDHDGTGTRSRHRRGTTGLTQNEYSAGQRRAVTDFDNPATPMHMNMIGYANQPSFRNPPRSRAVRQSDDGYERMLGMGTGRSPYIDDSGSLRTSRPLIPQERADLHAGRRVARGEPYPDAAEQDRLMRHYGAHSHQLRSGGSSGLRSLRDYPEPLDTSYRERSRPRRSETSQRERLRRLARGLDVGDSAYGGRSSSTADSLSRGRSRSRSRYRSRASSQYRGGSSADYDVTGGYDYGSGDYDDEPVFSQSAGRSYYDDY
ncbi:hypothetical protein [Streptomyces sp. NPDC088348]|uniref:hypothetical protein n=1 Tax=Streptomyces sp. NPDC088348 TaxID=3365853 RepID=UPI003829CB6A